VADDTSAWKPVDPAASAWKPVTETPTFKISPEAQKVYGKGELPPNLPQIVGRKALEYLPAATAITASALLPEAAIPAAIVFGGVGSGAQQGIEKAAGLPEAPKTWGEFQQRATGEGMVRGGRSWRQIHQCCFRSDQI